MNVHMWKLYECILIMRCKNHFYKKDDHQKCPQTVGNIYLRKGAKIMLYKKKDGYSEVTRY